MTSMGSAFDESCLFCRIVAGQVPATVKKELDGFALNRLQGALLAEAFRLLADDVISPADLDALVEVTSIKGREAT